jgi:hypothetical protein
LLDIFNFFKQKIKAEDLVKLSKGEEVSENLINLYFKIMEKINFVLLQVQSFMKTETPGGDAPTTDKVLYCNSNFIRKLRDCQKKSLDNTLNDTKVQNDYNEMIQDLIDNDTILIPFFPDKQTGERHPTVLVTLSPSKWRADLF